MVQYELIYGSLGTVAVLLLWVYLSAWIRLLGAYASAAVHEKRRASKEKLR